MDNIVPCCRGNFMKSVEILAFVELQSPQSWAGVGMKMGEVSMCFLSLHPAEGRDELRSEKQGPCKCTLCLLLIL